MGEMVECPSGLSGEIRGLTGKEARLLSDRQLVKSGMFLDKILDTCWVTTHSSGPYDLKADGRPDWSKVLVGDRFFIMLRVRAKTFGKDYGFKLQCSNPGCRASFDHTVDLLELPTRRLSETDAELFRNGNRLVAELPDGRNFTFRLPVGADEVKAGRAKVDSFVEPLMARIEEIEGLVDPSIVDQVELMKASAKVKRKYFEDGELGLVFAAARAMDEHDCGVETQISAECPSCFTTMDLDIPFGQGFLAPGVTGKR